mmetsp:Transcript_7010/g.17042  ORF Transcript_7010/g.17042 Transcript_7010/m.17042 type:complete len:82 (+) Transcript_7010:490-735(+)
MMFTYVVTHLYKQHICQTPTIRSTHNMHPTHDTRTHTHTTRTRISLTESFDPSVRPPAVFLSVCLSDCLAKPSHNPTRARE